MQYEYKAEEVFQVNYGADLEQYSPLAVSVSLKLVDSAL